MDLKAKLKQIQTAAVGNPNAIDMDSAPSELREFISDIDDVLSKVESRGHDCLHVKPPGPTGPLSTVPSGEFETSLAK